MRHGPATRAVRLGVADGAALATMVLVTLVALLATPSASVQHPVEAFTARTGTTAPAKTWTVAALGDSVAAGSNCDCTPFPDLYGRALADRHGARVTVHNLGEGGQTSDGLLGSLSPDAPAAAVVAGADVVTVTIGANDLDASEDSWSSCPGLHCFDATLDRLRANMDATLSAIGRLRHGRPTAVLVTGYWNVWLDGRVGAAKGGDYPAVSNALTRRVNDLLAGVATAHGATYVDVYTPFRGSDGDRDDTSLLLDDGDHPSSQGHQVIANALVQAGVAPLT